MKLTKFIFLIAFSKALETPQGVIQNLSPEKLESYGFKKYYNETFANNFVIIRVLTCRREPHLTVRIRCMFEPLKAIWSPQLALRKFFLVAEGLTAQIWESECLAMRILFSLNSKVSESAQGLNFFSDFPYGKTSEALEHNGAYYYYSSGNDFPMGFSPVKVD